MEGLEGHLGGHAGALGVALGIWGLVIGISKQTKRASAICIVVYNVFEGLASHLSSFLGLGHKH